MARIGRSQPFPPIIKGYLQNRVVYDTSANGGCTLSASTDSWTHVVADSANRFMVVFVSVNGSTAVSSVDYNGSAFTFLRADTYTTTLRQEIWYLVAPSTGSNTVTINLAGAVGFYASSHSFSNVDQTNPVDAQGGGNGAASNPSSSVTTVAAWAKVVDAVINTDLTFAADAPSTEIINQNCILVGIGTSQRDVAIPGSTTISWNSSTGDWAQSIISIKPKQSLNNYTLAIDQGSYTLTGQDVGLRAQRKITIDQGSYTLTGQDVRLLKGYKLTIDQGSYTLTGQDVGLTAQRKITIEQGSYTLTGQDVGLKAGRLLTVGQGSYTLTGQDITFIHGYTLTVGQGSYTLTGQDVGLRATRLITIAQGAYTLTGQDVTLTYDYIPTCGDILYDEPTGYENRNIWYDGNCHYDYTRATLSALDIQQSQIFRIGMVKPQIVGDKIIKPQATSVATPKAQVSQGTGRKPQLTHIR